MKETPPSTGHAEGTGRPFRAGPLLALMGLTLVSLVFVYPFAWMFFASFKENRQIFSPLKLWPGHFGGQYYGQLFSGEWIPFVRVFGNSLLIASAQAVGAVAVTSLAGYAFAKHRFPMRRMLFVVSLVVIVLPQQALAISLFTWLDALHLSNRLAGVILPGVASGLGILYFTQVFRQARMAGASEIRVYTTLLPMLASPLLSFGLVQFILAWHEHLIPMLVLSAADQQTLPLALASLYGSSLRFPFAVLMAGSTLTLIPTVLLFGLLHRRFKSSLSELLVH
jgi:multiple sugar transport system permease protein